MAENLNKVKFNGDGLIPVIAQDVLTGAVLMQAYMNKDALELTLQKGRMVYWSRSRKELWEKGATSGQVQDLYSLYLDCDGDCLLAKVVQHGGGACHTGEYSCFHNPVVAESGYSAGPKILLELAKVVEDRYNNPVEGSYTNYLFDKGIDKILKKVGEESAETIIAAKNASHEEIVYETADLFYHLLVMLKDRNVPLEAVFNELAGRRK